MAVSGLNIYKNVAASFGEGFSQTVALTRSKQLTASFAYGFSVAALLTHNSPQPTVRPTFSSGAAVALNGVSGGTTGAFAVTAGQYVVLHVTTGVTSGTPPTVSTVSGANVTWSKLGGLSNTSQTNKLRTETWGGLCSTSSASTTVTISLSGSTASGYASLSTWDHVNATNPVADLVVGIQNDSGTSAVPTANVTSTYANSVLIGNMVDIGLFVAPNQTGWSEFSGVQTGSMGMGSDNWWRNIDQTTFTTVFTTRPNWIMHFVVLKGT
jgi:hypothetical protein